jgi:nitrogen fixation/metabolism regulation signal transduction histidine kinase
MTKTIKRRSIWNARLTRRFHWHYMGLWIVLTALLSVALNVACYLMIESQGAEIHTLSHYELEDYLARRSNYLIGTIVQGVLTVIGIISLGIMTAHRVAGPYTRLAKAFIAVEGGDFEHKLSFRKYDQLKDIEDAFNAMMERIRERVGEADVPRQKQKARK